jgi:hypothetical protein
MSLRIAPIDGMSRAKALLMQVIFMSPVLAAILISAGFGVQDRTSESEQNSMLVEIGPPVPRDEDRPSRERSGGPMGGAGGPGSGPPGYRITWYPTRTTTPSGSDLQLIRQQFAFGLPILKRVGEVLLLNTGLRHSHYSTDLLLPDSGRPFPNDLWNVSLGLMYIRQFGDGWSGGLSTTLSSASDKPFNSLREMQLGLFGFLEVPAKNDRDAWLLSLMYQPTGNLNFPIPGVAYSWRPNDDLLVNLGIPLMVKAKPAERWSLSFTYLPVININARATYEWDEGVSLYGAFEWLNEAYFLADREIRRERFLVFEKRLVAGLRWDLWRFLSLDVNAGYAFDRSFGQGQNTISNQHDVVDVDAGPFLGAGLLIKR